MSKTYIVTAEIELEVLDCNSEEEAIDHAQWRVDQGLEIDFHAEEVVRKTSEKNVYDVEDYFYDVGEYSYDVEEYSQDVRRYEVRSNIKLTEYEVQQVYYEVNINKSGDISNDLQKIIEWDTLRPTKLTEDEIKKAKVSCKFIDTEYGDDCQVDIDGDLEVT